MAGRHTVFVEKVFGVTGLPKRRNHSLVNLKLLSESEREGEKKSEKG